MEFTGEPNEPSLSSLPSGETKMAALLSPSMASQSAPPNPASPPAPPAPASVIASGVPPLPPSSAAPAAAHEEPAHAPPSPPDSSATPLSPGPDDEQADTPAPAAKSTTQRIAHDRVRIIFSPSDSMPVATRHQAERRGSTYSSVCDSERLREKSSLNSNSRNARKTS